MGRVRTTHREATGRAHVSPPCIRRAISNYRDPADRTIRNIPTEVLLALTDGVPRRSVANADAILTVDKERITTYICTLSPSKLEAVERAIKFALDLP